MNAQINEEIRQAREHMEAALALLRESGEQSLSWRAYNLCADLEWLEGRTKEGN